MYENTAQFEPLILSARRGELLAQAGRIVQASLKLTASASETARDTIRELVRSMNSYYSNRIEGQSTHPLDIARALSNDFSQQPDIAKLQRIAVAHIDAEKELESKLRDGAPPLNADFLVAAHRALYSRLAPADRTLDDGHVIIPGDLRNENVEVGLHVPPISPSVPGFLRRMDEVYDVQQGWDNLLLNVACLHHRAAWVHPFRDGNGRAIRLQSHCSLWALSDGIWSPNRGLARTREDYYARLRNADAPRRGDLDGRGNLTDAGLAEWAQYFMDVCEDQVTFMTRMLALDEMKKRIEALVLVRTTQDKLMRAQAILPLHHTFAAGPLTRAEFVQMTGLGERTARTLLSYLLSSKLLVSDTALGPVKFGLPMDSLQFLLPQLYPEVNQLQ
ncbi:MAG: Fic family protein [Herminiimonas sp.]|nr:Fic family protein [Herminiimonas sp.]